MRQVDTIRTPICQLSSAEVPRICFPRQSCELGAAIKSNQSARRGGDVMTWLSQALLGETRRARVLQASFNCVRSIELDCQK